MTHATIPGGADANAPIPFVLPPALNGYRRNLFPGRATSVYFDRHPPNEWEPHLHTQDQVSGIVGDGTVTLKWETADRQWHERELGPGAFWVIPRGMPHALICPAAVDMVSLFMEVAFVADVLGQRLPEFIIVPLAQLASRDQVIAQHSKLFLRLCQHEARANAIYVESIGTVLGTHVLQTLFHGDAVRDLRTGLPDCALIKVMSFIDDHLGEELKLDDLAHAAGYSTGHFGVLFKRSMELTPHDYLMRRRLAKARDLLATTDRKEIDIALECGFSDDTHLTRWSRRIFKCLPKHLRGLGASAYEPVFPSGQPIPPLDGPV